MSACNAMGQCETCDKLLRELTVVTSGDADVWWSLQEAVARDSAPSAVGWQKEARNVTCSLPRGHEGEHRGELGEWTWRSE